MAQLDARMIEVGSEVEKVPSPTTWTDMQLHVVHVFAPCVVSECTHPEIKHRNRILGQVRGKPGRKWLLFAE